MGKNLLNLHQFFIDGRTIPIIIMGAPDHHGIIVLKAAAEFVQMVVEPAEGSDQLAMKLCERRSEICARRVASRFQEVALCY